MGYRKEYVVKDMIFTVKEIETLREFSLNLKADGFPDGDPVLDNLSDTLNAASLILSILSLAPVVPPIASIAATLLAVAGALDTSEKESIADVLNDGINSLTLCKRYMDKNKVDKIKINVAFLEFIDEKFRIVTSTTDPVEA